MWPFDIAAKRREKKRQEELERQARLKEMIEAENRRQRMRDVPAWRPSASASSSARATSTDTLPIYADPLHPLNPMSPVSPLNTWGSTRDDDTPRHHCSASSSSHSYDSGSSWSSSSCSSSSSSSYDSGSSSDSSSSYSSD